MRFFSAFTATALIAAVSASPVESTRAVANVPFPLAVLPETPAVVNGAKPESLPVTNEKRDLTKRALNIEVYYDLSGTGRHESLYSEINQCYNFGPDCSTAHEGALNVPGGNFIQDLRVYGIDDKISSYLCYQ
ncbi:hypothetical protein BCR34DRAFT_604241 [Clohesyomyces aquaticus]|uniref:Uncharacterized protein n=1 Tax=Clohesyomyces aquaticus TaxID=1231657 RepID=A0A1Y1Z855_9PLEO|nr:hypothetical protein BCR34DRAFT_604241 [Clohesyomyces aquaticus]